jgi:hypothetical protein
MLDIQNMPFDIQNRDRCHNASQRETRSDLGYATESQNIPRAECTGYVKKQAVLLNYD